MVWRFSEAQLESMALLCTAEQKRQEGTAGRRCPVRGRRVFLGPRMPRSSRTAAGKARRTFLPLPEGAADMQLVVVELVAQRLLHAGERNNAQVVKSPRDRFVLGGRQDRRDFNVLTSDNGVRQVSADGAGGERAGA